MLAVIEDDFGSKHTAAVADLMNYGQIRTFQQTLDLSLANRRELRHPKLVRVFDLMEQNIEEPLSPCELARAISISTRQLERLFRQYLGVTPKRYYTDVRLETARRLLIQTPMSVTEISVATGFGSASHFSRQYRRKFNTLPSAFRSGKAPV